MLNKKQSTVADMLNLALFSFAKYKEDHPHLDYKIIMPFHDAVYLDVAWQNVHEVIDQVMPYCMTEATYVPSIGLHLGSDIEMMYHWGHKRTPDEAIAESLAHLYIN